MPRSLAKAFIFVADGSSAGVAPSIRDLQPFRLRGSGLAETAVAVLRLISIFRTSGSGQPWMPDKGMHDEGKANRRRQYAVEDRRQLLPERKLIAGFDIERRQHENVGKAHAREMHA